MVREQFNQMPWFEHNQIDCDRYFFRGAKFRENRLNEGFQFSERSFESKLKFPRIRAEFF